VDERIDEEVEEIPEGKAVSARRLPVDRREAVPADDDVPAAEVVVLEDGRDGRQAAAIASIDRTFSARESFPWSRYVSRRPVAAVSTEQGSPAASKRPSRRGARAAADPPAAAASRRPRSSRSNGSV
jgi:hypothetical protein